MNKANVIPSYNAGKNTLPLNPSDWTVVPFLQFEHDDIKSVIAWVEDNCQCAVYFAATYADFVDPKDAVLFALRWSR